MLTVSYQLAASQSVTDSQSIKCISGKSVHITQNKKNIHENKYTTKLFSRINHIPVVYKKL